MVGKIVVGIIIFIAVWVWIMMPYYQAYSEKPISGTLVISAWIFIPAYIAVTGVYFLMKAGWL